MHIETVVPDDKVKSLWEERMEEKWETYAPATHFVQYDDFGNICAGFAVYWDNSDEVEGHYISGWSNRKNLHSVVDVIQHIADKLGSVFIKTDKRQMKIIGYQMGKLVKNAGRFSYFIIRGK